MICPNCGKELPDGSVFCQECGCSMPLEKSTSLIMEENGEKKNPLSIWDIFKNAVKSFYKDFTNGRSSRKEFWSTWLFTMLGMSVFYIFFFILTFIISRTGENSALSFVIGALLIIVMCPLIICLSFAAYTMMRLMIRRAHDIGNPWGVIFIPIYNLIVLFIPGTDGPNKFGEKPEI